MKSRMTLIFAALITIMGTLVFILQDRKTTTDAVAAVPQMTAVQPNAQPTIVDVQAAPVSVATVPAVATTAPSLISSTLANDADSSKVEQPRTAPLVRVDADGKLNYIARPGDTVSQLAIALLGVNSKANRDAIIAANDSLQVDPDRVLVGNTYSIAAAAADATADPVKTLADSKAEDQSKVQSNVVKAVDDSAAAGTSAPQPAVKSSPSASTVLADANGPQLKYTARPGDTVGVIAANLLGGDTKANRDLIIASNASLQQDPDHLEAGKTYTIVAANGLAKSAATPAIIRSSDHPDADEVAQLSVAPTLRYTAQPGDTVTKLATALLGSDTPANRQLILEANPSLKRDPDHLIAGKTYWITAPSANAMP